MKTLITNYIFDASEQKVTFSGYSTVELGRVLLITNTTDNVIIYNFADSSKGGTVSSSDLNLAYNTTSMADSDKLQIYYDAPSPDYINFMYSGNNVTGIYYKVNGVGGNVMDRYKINYSGQYLINISRTSY